MKRVLEVNKVLRVPANGDTGLWRAWVYNKVHGGSVCYFDFPKCSQAHDAAQAFCDRENAKAEPPDGFVLSTTPGVRGPDGDALAWVEGYGFEGLDPDNEGLLAGMESPWYWLVPAAPKKETREEAERRVLQFFAQQARDPVYESFAKRCFMTGAGFEP